MRPFFGYIRVSTPKQGETVSLPEQRSAILRYAERNDLTITDWFEERRTAAKRGRPVFGQMLRLLRQGKATGVIIHKIDRSARNLKDWADLGELIDAGIEVHTANETLDLRSRGGRLAADIQAVVAADYIRNLREETKKGFYGRLKQGVYPLPAPLGYSDRGAGKPKEPDPATAPLVRQAFELYAAGRYNLHTLREELHRRGLRNRRGRRLSINGLSIILNNPFYIGLIRLKRTRETFAGAHVPLIRKAVFDRVHAVLSGKTNRRGERHEFCFRRLLRCAHCHYALIAERQKGHVYYRCHTRTCPTTSLREDAVDRAVLAALDPLDMTPEEQAHVGERIAALRSDARAKVEEHRAALALAAGRLQDRVRRLTDAYVDGAISKELFDDRRAALLVEQKDLNDAQANADGDLALLRERLARDLELAIDAYVSYKLADDAKKRRLLAALTSNRVADGKHVAVMLAFPFRDIANRFEMTYGAPHLDIPRTWDRLMAKLMGVLQTERPPEPTMCFAGTSAITDDNGDKSPDNPRPLAA